MTAQNLTNQGVVYIGQSLYIGEGNCWTIGHATVDTLEDAEARKSSETHFAFYFKTKAEAERVERLAHKKADGLFGGRASVKHGLNDRNGDKPNRSGEWWYVKNFGQMLTIFDVINKQKQKNFKLEVVK